MLHSPTGYYALISTTRYIAGPDSTEVEDWSVTETYPVVTFQSGEVQIVTRAGALRLAREYSQEIREGYVGEAPEGVRFEVTLEVTPHVTEESA